MAEKKTQNILDPALESVLRQVSYPGFDVNLVDMELVESAQLENGKAVVKLKTVAAPDDVRQALEKAIAQAISQVEGVTQLELDMPKPPEPSKEAEGPKPIPGVTAVVPVASGKGGVGKSTVAANLALGLAKKGLKVGLLDLDLYGPSIPTLMGLNGKQPSPEGDKLAPLMAYGVKTMSIGLLMQSDKALIWRGPLLMKAVRQLFEDVAWAPLDVLVLDLPPGTGDVQITMAQEVPIKGAVVVTTPQDVALADAIKGVDMFKAVNAPVFGIVENMSYFICDGCGKRHEIFGNGSVEPLCKRLGVDYLGELPLNTEVRELSDQGTPPVVASPKAAEAYLALADKIAAKL